MIPTLRTERLVLSAPQIADFEHWADFFASDRAELERGRKTRREAYRIWAADVGLWTLRGYGPFRVADHGGRYVGEVGVYQSEGYPEPELGWFVLPEAEGQGYAKEAARAVLDWAHESFGWTRLVNYIDPRNARSIALGLRIGGVIDPEAPREDPEDVVIVHQLNRKAA